MKNACFFFSEDFLKHGYSDHIESKERLESVMGDLHYNILNDIIDFINPHSASEEEIMLVHDPDYVKYIIDFKEGMLDIDTIMSPGSLNAALKAAGAAIDGVREAKRGRKLSYGLVRPPGHHAMPDRAMGFCIFNNVAIGTAYALSSGYKRVLIVDWDVHHGNGTENMFYDNPDVLYFSVHQYPFYPGTGHYSDVGAGDGEGFNVNVPFSPGSTDADYASAFDRLLIPVSKEFKPDLIMVSAGYDTHYDDPLGSMKMTEAGFHMMASKVKEISDMFNAGIVAMLEGGYSLKHLPSSVEASILGFLGKGGGLKIDNKVTKAAMDNIDKAIDVQKNYWKSLRPYQLA
ncbi:histone deacetylase [Methanocella sp. CWC-04]|uniref:histone deacetylase n=1 Tax=Methanooceanicella nereidis TaxID=2052831 RepID=A0AAP2RDN6_9EURY|nr:histone deacetylase [Methanocella sp. CWC-04]MCD1294695.1 histone deacetylase [Methanocella sp. CWC-04]